MDKSNLNLSTVLTFLLALWNLFIGVTDLQQGKLFWGAVSCALAVALFFFVLLDLRKEFTREQT